MATIPIKFVNWLKLEMMYLKNAMMAHDAGLSVSEPKKAKRTIRLAFSG